MTEAFKKVEISTVPDSLLHVSIDDTVFIWIQSMLMNSTILSASDPETQTIYISRGTLQASVLYPPYADLVLMVSVLFLSIIKEMVKRDLQK